MTLERGPDADKLGVMLNTGPGEGIVCDTKKCQTKVNIKKTCLQTNHIAHHRW